MLTSRIGAKISRISLFIRFNIAGGLPSALQDKFLFLWTGNISDNELVNEVGPDNITINNQDFSTDYIPDDSDATFNIPDTLAYQTADEDNLWYDGSVQNVTQDQLVAQDYTRTLVKYADSSPYHVYWIGILKSGEVLSDAEIEQISRYFRLWAFWSGYWVDEGAIKENRTFSDPLGDNLIANGGAADTTDWVDTDSDGLADSFTEGGMGSTDFSIVTGNGFTGNAQRMDFVSGINNFLIPDNVTLEDGKKYYVKLKYRSNNSLSGCFVIGTTTITPEIIAGDLNANEGDAKEVELYLTNSTGSDNAFMFNLESLAFSWAEIDEFELKEVTI